MAYEIPLDRAWTELKNLSGTEIGEVMLLCEAYSINLENRSVICQSSGKPADDFLAVLILHYLIGAFNHGFRPSGDWISFKELWGGVSYYPAFRESTLKPLVEKLKNDPEGLLENLTSALRGRGVEGGDCAIELTAFPEVHIRIVMWYGDEELCPEAALLFDRNLAEIITTEDIAVLLQYIASASIELPLQQ